MIDAFTADVSLYTKMKDNPCLVFMSNTRYTTNDKAQFERELLKYEKLGIL